MRFDEEIHPRIEFSNNPLKVVVAQIKFPTMFGLTEPAALAELQGTLGARYSNALQRIPNVTLLIDAAGQPSTTTDAGPVRLASEDGLWIVAIAPDSIGLETKAYESWADFSGRLEELMAAVPITVRPHHTTRIGLRYVDQLQAPKVATPADWREYIVPGLIGGPDALIFDERLVQGIQQLSFVMDESVINVRHGFVRNPAEADLPSTYVIDTDAFTEAEQAFDWAVILKLMTQYHGWAWSVFRRSLTPAAVELLGGTQDD
jgi:uncharacterized protein (TIGR04255 family)